MVEMKASAQGWANAYLKHNPWNSRRNQTQREYEAKWLKQGQIAVNSVLRDWVKGQITAVETGMMSLEQVLMPHLLLPNGKTVIEAAKESNLLPDLSA